MIKKLVKTNIKPETPISVSDIQEETLYCNYCNLLLLRNGNDKQCPKCGIKYNPAQNIRHGTTIETMDGPLDFEGIMGAEIIPSVSYPPDVSIEKKPPELKGGFAELNKKGTIKFLNYVETMPK